jgi:hypothetical protein
MAHEQVPHVATAGCWRCVVVSQTVQIYKAGWITVSFTVKLTRFEISLVIRFCKNKSGQLHIAHFTARSSSLSFGCFGIPLPPLAPA